MSRRVPIYVAIAPALLGVVLLAAGCSDPNSGDVDGSPGIDAAFPDALFAPDTTAPSSSCVGLADGTACDDGNACTTGDSCSSGVCVGASNLVCDERGPCEPASCDPKSGCVYTKRTDGEPCDLACFDAATCQAGVCAAVMGTAVVCPAPSDPCVNKLACDSATGQCTVAIPEPEGTACNDDGNLCTLEACDGDGACVGTGQQETCEEENQNNPCWTYVCAPAKGCVTQQPFIEGQACDDHDPCTQSDLCRIEAGTMGQQVCAGVAIPVDDGNPCTDDGCDPQSGAISHRALDGASCESDDACGAGLCVGKTCEPSPEACQPPRTRCASNGQGLQSCKANGCGWEAGPACPCGCEEGATGCRAATCTPDTHQCDADGNVLTCASDGCGWEVEQACPCGCSDGACATNVCTPNTKQCTGATVETCAADGCGWTTTSTCGCGCSGGVCAEPTCSAGQYGCEGSVRVQCAGDGCGWDTVESCSCGCSDGVCTNNLCSPNGYRCNGDTRERCDGDGCGWSLAEGCACGCSGTSCVAPACSPGTYRCTNGTRERCASDGCGWEFAESCGCGCSGDACATQTCSPNQPKCSGNTRLQCQSDGCGWTTLDTCACGCSGGYCTGSGVCPANTYRCSGNNRQRCDANGCGWTTVDACACGCSGGSCLAQVCSPYDYQCVGGTRQRCSSSGCGWSTIENCPAGCAGDECAAVCPETHYWSPYTDTDTDSVGNQHNGDTINVAVRFETKEDGHGLQFRVCKGSGKFTDNVDVQLHDGASGSASWSGTIVTKDRTCSSWYELGGDNSYAPGDVFGGVWQVVSPSSVSGQWSSCSTSTASGTCWDGVYITMTRTCLE